MATQTVFAFAKSAASVTAPGTYVQVNGNLKAGDKIIQTLRTSDGQSFPTGAGGGGLYAPYVPDDDFLVQIQFINAADVYFLVLEREV